MAEATDAYTDAALAEKRARIEAATAAVEAQPDAPRRAERLRDLSRALLDWQDPCPACDGTGGWTRAQQCADCGGGGSAEDLTLACGWCGDSYPQHRADALGAHLICPACAALHAEGRLECDL